MTGPLYRLQNLVKAYGQKEVCRIEELDIHPGEILGVMGPSGAGKSTLLRLLNFLEPPSSGALTFLGYPCSNGNVPLALRRRVTMVFQEPVLFNATVEANIAYGLRIRGEKGMGRQVAETLERVGLRHLAKAQARTLSGGEAQRVALGRALVLTPQVLLLDEPTANLDPYNVALLEGLIVAVNREGGTTIVLVTHNVFQARRLAHRVAFLLEGQVVEAGETGEVFSHPRDRRTLAFIQGEMVY